MAGEIKTLKLSEGVTVTAPDDLTIDTATGSSAGAKNYVTNPSAEIDLADWSESTDGAVDLTRTTTAAELPRETTTGTGLKVIATAAATGEYVKFNTQLLDDADKGADLRVQFAVKPIAGYTDSDFEVEVWDTAGPTQLTVANPGVLNQEKCQSFAFTGPALTSSAIELRIVSTVATSPGMVISDVIMGPAVAASGAGGSGTGEINYISNPDAADNLNGIVDSGTGTSSSQTTTASELPRASLTDTAIKISNDGSGTGYTRFRWTLGLVDQNKMLKLEIPKVTGSSYESGDFKVELYTNAASDYSGAYTEITLTGGADILEGTHTHINTWNSTTETYYELRIVRVAGGSLADDFISIGNLVAGPGKIGSGVALSGWTAYTPGELNNWTSSARSGIWRQVGDSIEIYAEATIATISSTLEWNFLPSGYTVSSTIDDAFTNRMPVGHWTHSDGSTFFTGIIGSPGSGLARFYVSDNNAVTATNPSAATFAAGDELGVHAVIPVTELEGKGTANLITQDNLSEWTSFTPTGSAWINGNVTPTGFYKKIGDSMKVKVYMALTGAPGAANLSINIPAGKTVDTAKLTSTNSRQLLGIEGFAHDSSTGDHFDVTATYSSTSSVSVRGLGDNYDSLITQTGPFTWATGDNLWVDFEVPIAEWAGSQSSLVGFSDATATNSGLVKKNVTQIKHLTADVATSGVMSDLSFTLTAGQLYWIRPRMRLSNNDADSRVDVLVKDGATTIMRIRNNNVLTDAGDQIDISATDGIPHVMVNTSLTFEAESASANATVKGNATLGEASFVAVTRVENEELGTVT